MKRLLLCSTALSGLFALVAAVNPVLAQTVSVPAGTNLSTLSPPTNSTIWDLVGNASTSAPITLPTGTPGLTITGAAGGSTITLNDGAGHYGRLASGGSVLLNFGGNLTFTGGNAGAGSDGGAISVNSARITGLANTGTLTFSNNTARSGGAIAEAMLYNGIGLLITGSYGAMIFDGNTATETVTTNPGGGAISAAKTSLSIDAQVTGALAFTNNRTNGGTGGAIVGYGNGTVSVTGSYGSILFDNNRGSLGGGISTGGSIAFNATTAGTFTATGNTATATVAAQGGGGFLRGDAGVSILGNYGGGIAITGNTAAGFGGAIHVAGGGNAPGIVINATAPTITISNNAATGANSYGGALYSSRGFQLNLVPGTVFTAVNNSAGGVSGAGNDTNGGFLYAGTSMLFNIGAGASATIGDASSIANRTDSIAAAAAVPLTKTGAGTLILNANNVYAGGTLLNGGVVQVYDDRNLGAASGTLTFNGGALHTTSTFSSSRAAILNSTGTFDTDAATTLTMAGIISGAGGLTKTGTGTLTLSGENTYRGATSNSVGSTLQIGTGGASGSLASASLANAGTLIFNRSTDSAYSGRLSGAGTMRKEGAGTLTLNANGSGTSQQGSADVRGGTLRLAQDNGDPATPTPFSVTGAYTTRTGATTELGTNNSVLDIGGVFTQEAGSALRVELGAWTNGGRADIIAGSATLAGSLEILGFTAGDSPNSSSVLTTQGYKLLETTTGPITGYYSGSNLIGAGSSGLDYLSISSALRANGNGADRELWLGFALNWTDGGQGAGTGNFTLDTGRFTVDTVLADQTGPFDSGWNGRDLTKRGTGTLRLAEHNTYTGITTVDEGTLQAFNDGGTSVDNVFQGSSDVRVNAAGTLDINGTRQIAQRLGNDTATGGRITLNGGALTADNTTGDSAFSGTIDDGDTAGGSLIKTGSGALTLSGKTLWTGDTHVNAGTLTLDGIRGQGYADLTGNIVGQDGATVQLVRGARLTGWIDPLDVLIDDASTWTMTADSQVRDLSLAGTLAIAPPTSGTGAFKTLTVEGNHTGTNGLMVFNGALAGDDSPVDRLVVAGNTAGTTRVQVNNIGGSGAATVDGIELIAVRGQSDGTFVQEGRIVAGAYDYRLARGTGANAASNWYLTSQLSSGPSRRPEGGSYAANAAAAASLFALRWEDHNRRQGDTAAAPEGAPLKTLWLRAEGGHARSQDDSGQLRTKSNRTVFQLGNDIAHWETGSDRQGQIVAGLMGGYGSQRNTTRATSGGHSATGRVDGYHVGVYGSWQEDARANRGWYADSWAYYSWLDNTVNGRGLAAEHYKAKGLTASVETGYTFMLGGGNDQTGYYLQPQAQLVWMGTQADDHRESNGTRIGWEGDTNLQSRLGIKAFAHTRGGATPFVEAGVIHNSAQVGAVLDGVTVRQGGNRTLGELRAGIEGRIDQDISVSGKLGHQMGSEDYRDTSLTVEVKIAF